jgi:SSS family solute:Na+ symporter
MLFVALAAVAHPAITSAQQAQRAPVRPAGTAALTWKSLPDLPDRFGFAGPFAGVSNGALIVAGGANFPDGPPWEGHAKVWHDRVFVLPKPNGAWVEASEKLPRPIGYCVSVSTPLGIVCIGGGDAKQHYRDVFVIEFKDGRINRRELPPLPVPLSEACGAALNNVIYVAGGYESPTATVASNKFLCIDLSAASPQWKELATWPGPERILPVAGVQAGSFFLFGGAQLVPGDDGKAKRNVLLDAYKFTPGAGWQRIADLPRAVTAAPSPAAPIGLSHLFVLGGDDRTSFKVAPKDHPGFAKDILAYHTITNTWVTAGEMTHVPQAVTTLVPWAGGFAVPSGEIRPGIRTPQVRVLLTSPAKTGFGWINYLTLGVYPLIMLGISYLVGKKHTSDEFFRGGQRIPWWAAGLSIYATMLSSITYMAIPAKAYATDWAYFVGVFAIVAITPVVAYLYLPFFRQLNLTSAYEYLELRFNLATRWFGSASFLILQLGRTAIVLYLPSLALATVTQIDVVTCILLMGAISILMTFLGGVESVIWTDVAQTVILLAGAAVSLAFIVMRSDLTVGQMFETAVAQKKFFGDARWDWSWTAATLSVIFVGNFLSNLIPYTASQDVVQRYLTTKDQKQAARAIMSNALLTFPSSILFFAVGTALFVFYRTLPARLDPTIATDAVFPLFMVRELPAGVAGLVVAGIFAAAQPTSNLNSMATAVVTDFYQRSRPHAPDAKVLRLAQQLTVLFGILGTAAAVVVAKMEMASLWDLFLKVIGLTGGSLAGLFALGIFTTRANGRGALVGAAAGVVILFYVQVCTNVTFFLYGGIGIVACFVVGYIASLLLPGAPKPLQGLTLYTARRPAPQSTDAATPFPAAVSAN